jgi:hypothetical protein
MDLCNWSNEIDLDDRTNEMIMDNWKDEMNLSSWGDEKSMDSWNDEMNLTSRGNEMNPDKCEDRVCGPWLSCCNSIVMCDFGQNDFPYVRVT